MKLLKPSALTIFISMASLTGAMMSTNAHAISKNQFLQSYSKASNVKSKHIPIVYHAEKNATSSGKVVLRQARRMALEKRTVVKGSCWDYINAVFKKAGVKRKTIFKQTKNGGKYINKNKIQAGDWLYHINYSYNNVEHSGIFIGWVDKANSKALMLSYRGANHKEPARYKVYNIRSTYNVMRPQHSASAKAASEQLINNEKQERDFLALESVDDMVLPTANPTLSVSNGRPIQVVQGISVTEEQLTDPYYIESKPFHIPTVEAVKELQPKLIHMPSHSRKGNNAKITVQHVTKTRPTKRVTAISDAVMKKSIALENSVPTPDASVKVENKVTILKMPVLPETNLKAVAPVIEAEPVVEPTAAVSPVIAEVSPVIKAVVKPALENTVSVKTKVEQAQQIMGGSIKRLPVAKAEPILKTVSKAVQKKPIAQKPASKPAKKLTKNSKTVDKKDLKDFQKFYAKSKNVKRQYLPMMHKAEQTAMPAAKKVLGLGRVMTLDRREILQGTSRNYINAIFVRTGVDKKIVFKKKYPKGPFIDSNKIESGDWVSFINHSYKNVEHNGVFVGWTDKAKKKALILSYPGEGSRKPARYRVYDLRHVYEVKRPIM